MNGEQLRLFPIGTPCEYGDHEWCRKHWVGWLENGVVIKCRCRCHAGV